MGDSVRRRPFPSLGPQNQEKKASLEYSGLYCASCYVTKRDGDRREKRQPYCPPMHHVPALQPARATFDSYNPRGSSFKIRFVTQKERQDQRQETEEARKTKDFEGTTQEP